MRSLASIATLGALALGGVACAQSLTEHAAAAAGATIGTAAGKPIAKALSGIFDNVDDATATAAKTGNKTPAPKATISPYQTSQGDKAASTNRGAAPGTFSPGFGTAAEPAAASDYTPRARRASSRRLAGQMPATAHAVSAALPPVIEPVKEPSLEELARIQIGTSEQDVFAALGKPESHISVPSDNGHMLESCQYWARGAYLGTVRLDNGQVVKVESRAQD